MFKTRKEDFGGVGVLCSLNMVKPVSKAVFIYTEPTPLKLIKVKVKLFLYCLLGQVF
jgi:hypothetical protein